MVLPGTDLCNDHGALFLFRTGKTQIAGMPAFVCHKTSPEAAMRAAEEGTEDIEVAIPVKAFVAITENTPAGALYYELPGGAMVKGVHKGPYAVLEVTYTEIFTWMARHRREVTGPIREVYGNDPGEVAEENILTEIYVPVG